MDDLSMLSIDGVTFESNKPVGTTRTRSAGADDDIFMDNPTGGNNLTNTVASNLTIGDDSDDNNQDNHSKMDGSSIIYDLISAAFSLSSNRNNKANSSAASTQNNNATDIIGTTIMGSSTGNKTSQELQQGEIDKGQRKTLALAIVMKDVHEILREQHKGILREIERQAEATVKQAIEKQKALHRKEIEELKAKIATSQRPGMVSMRRFNSVEFSSSGGTKGHAGGAKEGDNGSGGNHRKDRVLEEDVYSLMMLNEITNDQELLPYPYQYLRRIQNYAQRLCIVVSICIWMNFTSSAFSDKMSPIWFDFDDSTFLDEMILFVLTFIFFGLAMSSPWFLGIVTFLYFQLFLALMIIRDQLMRTKDKCEENRISEEVCIPFDLPFRLRPILSSVQYVTGILVLATQTDVLTAILNVIRLRNTNHVPWDSVVGVEGNRTWNLWITRILLPNVFKFIQAFVILIASFVIIIQSEVIVDLLKDFTAVLVVSQSDNILFSLADMGYLGRNLAQMTEEVKEVHWCNASIKRRGMRCDNVDGGQSTDETRGTGNADFFSTGGSCFSRVYRRMRRIDLRVFIFNMLCVMMFGGITFIKVLQIRGTLARMKYPNCTAKFTHFLSNGVCNDSEPYNTAQCGYDGGDCGNGFPKAVPGYPDCFVFNPDAIGNDECWDWSPYNTPECGFDGGDCLRKQGLPVDGYPDCFVSRPDDSPMLIGDGYCHDYPPYNTPECGFDDGDCKRNAVKDYPNCFVHYPGAIGDGNCNNFPPYNTTECGFDGGDCAEPIPVDR